MEVAWHGGLRVTLTHVLFFFRVEAVQIPDWTQRHSRASPWNTRNSIIEMHTSSRRQR